MQHISFGKIAKKKYWLDKSGCVNASMRFTYHFDGGFYGISDMGNIDWI